MAGGPAHTASKGRIAIGISYTIILHLDMSSVG